MGTAICSLVMQSPGRHAQPSLRLRIRKRERRIDQLRSLPSSERLERKIEKLKAELVALYAERNGRQCHLRQRLRTQRTHSNWLIRDAMILAAAGRIAGAPARVEI